MTSGCLLSVLLVLPVLLPDIHPLILVTLASVYALILVPFSCGIYWMKEWNLIKIKAKSLGRRCRRRLNVRDLPAKLLFHLGQISRKLVHLLTNLRILRAINQVRRKREWLTQ